MKKFYNKKNLFVIYKIIYFVISLKSWDHWQLKRHCNDLIYSILDIIKSRKLYKNN